MWLRNPPAQISVVTVEVDLSQAVNPAGGFLVLQVLHNGEVNGYSSMRLQPGQQRFRSNAEICCAPSLDVTVLSYIDLDEDLEYDPNEPGGLVMPAAISVSSNITLQYVMPPAASASTPGSN